MSRALNILILEDSQPDAEITKRLLDKAGFNARYKIVTDERSYRNALGTFQPDVILSDHSLPQFDSVRALEIFGETKLKSAFILVTGAVSEEFAVKIIKDGADDYLLKDNLSRLPNAIKNAVRQKETDKKNEEIIEELDTFLYRTSHDLKGPVASMLGLINLGLEKVRNQDSAEFFRMIKEQAKRLETILNELNKVVRIHKGEPVPQLVDFRELVREILSAIAFMEGFNSIKIVTEISAIEGFYSDKFLLTSILQNLIENAIKYRKRRERDKVTISIRDTNYGARIEIADNGIGIPEKHREEVFHMFFRANNVIPGMGLGLYTVKNCVRRLGGTIELGSSKDMITIFTIIMPSLEKKEASA